MNRAVNPTPLRASVAAFVVALVTLYTGPRMLTVAAMIILWSSSAAIGCYPPRSARRTRRTPSKGRRS